MAIFRAPPTSTRRYLQPLPHYKGYWSIYPPTLSQPSSAVPMTTRARSKLTQYKKNLFILFKTSNYCNCFLCILMVLLDLLFILKIEKKMQFYNLEGKESRGYRNLIKETVFKNNFNNLFTKYNK